MFEQTHQDNGINQINTEKRNIYLNGLVPPDFVIIRQQILCSILFIDIIYVL